MEGLIWIFFAVILFGMSITLIILLIMRAVTCNVAVGAEYVSCYVNRTRGGNSYYPIFRFCYNGIQYEEMAFPGFTSQKALQKECHPGSRYQIFINPKNPKKCTMNKKLTGEHIRLLIMCFFLMGAAGMLFCIGLGALIFARG